MKKRINSLIYTFGKFGKGWREILDTDNPNLYSHGRYPTKITADDLPKDYLKKKGKKNGTERQKSRHHRSILRNRT